MARRVRGRRNPLSGTVEVYHNGGWVAPYILGLTSNDSTIDFGEEGGVVAGENTGLNVPEPGDPGSPEGIHHDGGSGGSDLGGGSFDGGGLGGGDAGAGGF